MTVAQTNLVVEQVVYYSVEPLLRVVQVGKLESRNTSETCVD
jgi:hypothetical protein